MTSSACNAPASFIAWNSDIMSRGVTPREFKAEATRSTVGISGNTIIDALSSFSFVSVLGVTVVWPVWLKGLGCETVNVEAMLIVKLPWDTAQLAMRMRESGHNRSGAFVDHHARRHVRSDFDRFHERDKIHRRGLKFIRHPHPHGGGIQRERAVRPLAVQCFRQPRRRSKIRFPQNQFHIMIVDNRRRNFAFHHRAVGDLAHRGMVLHNRCATSAAVAR